MNFLKLISILACPVGVLELSFRVFQKSPPEWVADTMAIALILIGSERIANFLRRGKPAVFQDKTIWTQPTGVGLPDGGQASQGVDWGKAIPGLFHEIRNYSSTLRGNAQLLRRQTLSSSMLEPLGRLERTSAKIECLAKEFLEVSSLTQSIHPRVIAITEVIEECILDHFSEIRGSFDLQIPTDIPPVQADFLKLERVFLNLFRNAREAGTNRILVRVTGFPKRLRISVEDDGEGCSDEQIGKLFRPLYTSKKTRGGTGLGLYMVKAILESHGGNIRAESKNGLVGKGSGMIFTLELPIVRSRSKFTLERYPFRMSTVKNAI